MTDKDVEFYRGLQLPADTRVVELGVRDGSSLLLWRRLWPEGTVAGVDHNARSTWPTGTHRVVSSQAGVGLRDRLRALAPAWDLVVDDASHDGALTWRSWEMLWPLVEPGGWYVIEDWRVGHFNPGTYGRGMLDVALTLTTYAENGEVDELLLRPTLLAARRPA